MSEVAEDLQATDATPVTPSDTAGAVPVAGDLFDSDSADTLHLLVRKPLKRLRLTLTLRIGCASIPMRCLSSIARNVQAQFTRTQQDAKDRLRQADMAMQQQQSQQSRSKHYRRSWQPINSPPSRRWQTSGCKTSAKTSSAGLAS